MSEFALNASETRPSRPKATPRRLAPWAMGAVGTAALAGFAMAASSMIGVIVAPPAKISAPVIAGGLASQWPDLKDGLPVVAGTAVTPKPDTTIAQAPAKIEPVKVAALSNGAGAVPGFSNAAPPAPPTLEAKTPIARIPVPTPVAVVPPPPAVKPVVPSRAATVLPPRETVRARDEASPPSQEATAPSKPEAPKPVAEVAKVEAKVKVETKVKVESKAETARPREATAEKKVAARPVATGAGPEKPQKAVVAQKSAPAHHPDPVKTTVASAEPEETNILGVKLPSLAPAGRKIQESVSALGDAVRNAF